MLSHVEAAREQVMQQFDELTQNIRSSIPRLNEIKDAVNNRKCPESAPHPASTACLSCPGAGRAGRIDQLRRDVELAKTQQEQQSLIASYMSKLGGCAPNPIRPCPRLCCLLMRSPFAQHGSHVPERAPGHHSVIVATAPLLCPPPSRGAELDGASGSHGCGVFLRWVLPKLVGYARICTSDIDQKFTTILFYLCRRVPARLVELRAAEDPLRHLPVIPRLNRQPQLHRHCRPRVPAHHTPHPASALLCFLPAPCTGSSRGGVRTRWRVWTCAR